MNTIFSLARVRQLFAYDWTMNYKDKLYLAIIVFLAVISSFTFLRLDYEIAAVIIIVISAIILSYAPYFLASHIFANMRTKQDSIAFMMLPATKFEKFLVRFIDFSIVPSLIILIVGALAFGICVLCMGTDFMNQLYDTWLKGYTVMLQNPQFRLYFTDLDSFICQALAGSLAGLGIYTLGGSIFGRFAFVKTMAIMLVFDLFYAVLYNSYAGDFNVVLGSMKELGFWTNLIVAVACPIISYVIYSRKQVA